MPALPIRCRSCSNDTHPHNTLQNSEGNPVCFTCIALHHVSCSGCSTLLRTNNSQAHNGERYCGDCYRNSFRSCSSCFESRHQSELESDNNDYSLCRSCAPNYVRCSVSGVWMLRTAAIERNGVFYHEQHVPVRHKIQRYNWKPNQVLFLGKEDANNLFFGVELEIERGGSTNLKCDELMAIVNPEDEPAESVMYGKHDGSVDVGFEMVSHPASFDYHMNVLPWEALLVKAKEMGYSENPTTCGLHVHISRRYFGQSPARQDVGTMKLLYLVEKFWDNILIFSRRNQSAIDRWASRYGMQDKPRDILDEAKSGQGRYKAVNLENTHTLELRLFKGTLDYQTVRATIQMCYVLATTSKELSVIDVTQLTWDKLLVRCSEYPELYKYMKSLQLVPLTKTQLRQKRHREKKRAEQFLTTSQVWA
jgi:hypothetical protein